MEWVFLSPFKLTFLQNLWNCNCQPSKPSKPTNPCIVLNAQCLFKCGPWITEIPRPWCFNTCVSELQVTCNLYQVMFSIVFLYHILWSTRENVRLRLNILYSYTHEIDLIVYNSPLMTFHKCSTFRSDVFHSSCMAVAERPSVVGRRTVPQRRHPHPWNCDYVRLRGKGELRLQTEGRLLI